MKSIPLWSAILLALAAGSMMALQSRVNGELAARLDDPFTGTALVFLCSNLVLAALLPFWKPGRDGLARVTQALKNGDIPPWMILGGLVGGTYVLSQSLVVTTLGVALFSVASVGGQTIGGAVMDRTSIVPGGPHLLTPARLLGALLTLAAVAITQFSSFSSGVPPWMLLLPIAVGIAQGWQQAVNARVRIIAQSTFTSTLFNGVTGLAILIPLAIIQVARNGVPGDFPGQWWLYTGGVFGIVFAGLASIVVHRTGALVYTLLAVTGQLSTALILDLARHASIPATTVIGLALAMIGVVIGSLRKRPPQLRRQA